MLKIGDDVVVLTDHGLVDGRIVVLLNSYVNGTYVPEYGVRLENQSRIQYFTEDKLFGAIPPLELVIGCDCGAESAHFPNQPPGHANWCQLKGMHV